MASSFRPASERNQRPSPRRLIYAYPEEYSVMSIRVFDPTAEDAPATNSGATRLTSLEGRTIGLLDNNKFRVRELLDHVEAILRTRFVQAHVLRYRKPDSS